jgi:ACS family sodium-dependent inorganic phosphate cotransporter
MYQAIHFGRSVLLCLLLLHLLLRLLSLQFLEGVSGWRRRWTMVVLCFVAFMLCNMDRVNMSIAILPMSQQYGWNTQTVGLVQSSFFW